MSFSLTLKEERWLLSERRPAPNFWAQNGLFHISLPVKSFRALLSSSFLCTCPAHLNLYIHREPYWVNGPNYEVLDSSPFAISSLLSPNTLLGILFSNNFSYCWKIGWVSIGHATGLFVYSLANINILYFCAYLSNHLFLCQLILLHVFLKGVAFSVLEKRRSLHIPLFYFLSKICRA